MPVALRIQSKIKLFHQNNFHLKKISSNSQFYYNLKNKYNLSPLEYLSFAFDHLYASILSKDLRIFFQLKVYQINPYVANFKDRYHLFLTNFNIEFLNFLLKNNYYLMLCFLKSIHLEDNQLHYCIFQLFQDI